MENILVAGANGTTGKIIISLLQESNGFNPVAMVRKEEQVDYFKSKNIETVLGDLEDDLSDLFSKTSKIDKVIFAAGSGGKNVIGVDQEGAMKLVDVSKNSDVKKFVMLSSMGADNPESVSELKDYLIAKGKADDYLKSSGLNYTIVRPGTLTNNSKTESIELEVKLNKRGEISRADVAKTLVESLKDELAKNATFEIIEGETAIQNALQKVN